MNRLLLCGCNGILGSKVITKLLQSNPNLYLRLALRNKTRIHPSLQTVLSNHKNNHNHFELINADLSKPSSLTGITNNIDGILSMIDIIDPNLIINGQSNLLNEVIESENINKIKRFIPSEFGINMSSLSYYKSPSISGRIDFRNELVNKYKMINYTTLNCGCFMEGIFGWLQHYSPKNKSFNYWGDGQQLLDITCTNDIAQITSDLLLSDSMNLNQKHLAIVGNQISSKQIVDILKVNVSEEINGISHGDIEDLRKMYFELREKHPENPIKWGMYSYYLAYFGGEGKFEKDYIDKSIKLLYGDEKSNIPKFTSVEEFVLKQENVWNLNMKHVILSLIFGGQTGTKWKEIPFPK